MSNVRGFVRRAGAAVGGPAAIAAITGDILRAVKVGDYQLYTWDTAKTDGGKSYIGYRFISPSGVVLFQGTDIGVPADIAIDSDATLTGVLGFLVLRPGDTDPDYFSGYTD